MTSKIDADNYSLPPGVNGIARLIDVGFHLVKEGGQRGQFYFIAKGEVVQPQYYEGRPIRGMWTRIGPVVLSIRDGGERLSNSEFEVRWGRVSNYLRMLGAGPEDLQDENRIESVCEEITQARPYFRFRTWTPVDGPDLTMHTWDSRVEYVPNWAGDGVEDTTEEAE